MVGIWNPKAFHWLQCPEVTHTNNIRVLLLAFTRFQSLVSFMFRNLLITVTFVLTVGGTQIVQWKSLREVTALDPKSIRAGQTFKAKATIIQIKRENLFYKACVVCSKKVLDNGNGYFTCTKCGEDRQDFILRLTLHVSF